MIVLKRIASGTASSEKWLAPGTSRPLQCAPDAIPQLLSRPAVTSVKPEKPIALS
jgi:hypothetical protein